MQYDTGDHVAVLPENGPEIVEAAAAALGLPLETVFDLRLPPGNPQQLSPPFPGTECHSLHTGTTRRSLSAACSCHSWPSAAAIAALPGCSSSCGRNPILMSATHPYESTAHYAADSSMHPSTACSTAGHSDFRVIQGHTVTNQ